VRGVDFDAVVARRLHIGGRAAEGLDDRPDLDVAHLVRGCGVARLRDRRRAHRHHVGLPARRLAPEVDELAEDPGAVTVHGVAPSTHHRDAALVPCLEQNPSGKARRLVHAGAAGDDQPHAAARAFLLQRNLAVGDAPHLDQARAHRGLDDPVPDLDVADPAGSEEMRIRRCDGLGHQLSRADLTT
jgi:hypothetical protein